jgi:hypothetical protein
MVGMKCFFCFVLSTFLQCWAFHFPQALCLASPQSSELLKLGSSPKLWQWNEREMRWER